MTDKQIIIDDYFRKIVDINGKIVDYEIKNSDVSKLVQKIEKYNSYIKLKEQECEELKEECRKYGKINEQETKDYAELKAENERLKKEIRLYDCIDKWGTEQCRCACRCLGNEFCDAAEKKMKNIKQTLADIKELLVKTPTDSPMHCVNAKSVILQKISEVEK